MWRTFILVAILCRFAGSVSISGQVAVAHNASPEASSVAHPRPPVLLPNSTVMIALERGLCYGSCPAYRVRIGTDGVVVFEGKDFVLAEGRHTGHVDPITVRRLAHRFIEA